MVKIRREAKLALTAISAVVILIWGINFLKAKALFDKNNVFYGVYDRVDGLKVSSSVVYRGYSVGQVNDIRFVGERFDRVLVQFTVDNQLEIPANTVASIESADLMGGKAIHLVPGDAADYARNGDTLRSRIAEGLTDRLKPLEGKVESIVTSLDSVLLAVRELFDREGEGSIRSSLEHLNRTLENAEQVTGTLNGMLDKEAARISGILADIQSVTGNLKNNNENISQGMENLVAISDSLRAADLSHTIRTLNGILAQTDEILSKINHGQGTLGGVVNDDALYYNLTLVSENLNKLLQEFRQNPKRFVRLSLVDFGSGKAGETGRYGIVLAESEAPLPLNAPLYQQYPDLKQLLRNGTYLYVLETDADLKQANKKLEAVREKIGTAYLVKID